MSQFESPEYTPNLTSGDVKYKYTTTLKRLINTNLDSTVILSGVTIGSMITLKESTINRYRLNCILGGLSAQMIAILLTKRFKFLIPLFTVILYAYRAYSDDKEL